MKLLPLIFCLAGTASAQVVPYTFSDPQLYRNVPVPVVSSNVPTAGLLAWWKMDEGSGFAVADSTGNGHGLILVNGAGWTTGISGSALSIAGGSQWANTTGFGSAQIGTSFTISMWVQPVGVNNAKGFFSIADTGSSGSPWIILQMATSTESQIYWGGGYQMQETAISSSLPPCHYVCTFDPVSTTMKSYTNGVFSRQLNGNGSNSGTTCWVGNGYNASFTGWIDDMKIFNRPLNATEVLQLYNHPGQ